MLISKLLKYSCLLLMFVSTASFGQDETPEEQPDNNSEDSYVFKKGFRAGLYVGAYFANKYTASMYDGYGFDIDGNKNNWDNSLMNQKINMQYGGYGYSGQPDQIAQTLNVDYHTWTFAESNMAANMRYNPAIMVGLNSIYSVDVRNSIILNLNLVTVTASGNFTIYTPQSNNYTPGGNTRVNVFSITGKEQRMLLQFGYQRLLGDVKKINFFIEGGLHGTLAKFSSNEVLINSLKIDLLSYYNSAYYPYALPYKKKVSFGLGAFAGFGVNMFASAKFTVQLLYQPTYERINMGVAPTLKLQNSVGIRMYYNM